MTADGHFQVPQPTNEAVRSYAPNDPHRKTLKSRLAELTDARTEAPMLIGDQRRWGASRGAIPPPHLQAPALAPCALRSSTRFPDPINAPPCSRPTRAGTP